jgi:hypothetical protein
VLRLFSWQSPDTVRSLWDVPNLLMQKTPADSFVATTKLIFTPNTRIENEQAGLVVMGRSYARVFLKSKADGIHVMYGHCKAADKGKPEEFKDMGKLNGRDVYFRGTMRQGGKCNFSYSENGTDYKEAGSFQATEGQWIGAKLGIFCTRDVRINDAGYADFDWFRITRLP